MEAHKENQLQLSLTTTNSSLKDSLDSQKELFRQQIDQLQNIVLTQCNLTGVNPLSQEMAAGALSIKIGKRPRDLLNPKAIKYMQSIFAIKDAISKRECREISALFGVTATQVREFFSSQRTRVRKFVRLSKEKETRITASNENSELPCSDPNIAISQVLPITSVAPISVEEPSLIAPDEDLPEADDSDKLFVQNIFSLMRKEESFTGQEKLMEWILQVQNTAVLCWFLTKGGVMILATWLTQAAAEEQTSILHIVLKVLCHLPLHKALPVHMSAILQSVNKLRFYKSPDVSNRARVLLARWSKIFARSQAMRKPNALKSSSEAQDEMLLKQSIGEIMEIESWESKTEISEGTPMLLIDSAENSRKFESPQPLKLLTSAEDSNKKLIRGAPSSQNRERRKVQLVEQPGQKGGRNQVSSRSSHTTQSRPLSADDIQKAKMRAQFMQNKHGKAITSTETNTQTLTLCSSSQTTLLLTSSTKVNVRPRVEEIKKPDVAEIGNNQLDVVCNGSLKADEPPLKKMKMIQIPWRTPPEIRMSSDWSVGSGENSKEVEIQRNRLRREKETLYRSTAEIPSNPNEPWDTEMEYDDTLTPLIPTEQLPDLDTPETPLASPRQTDEPAVTSTPAASSSQNGNLTTLEPDLELLAVLLKNPELVMALTSGKNGNLSSQETVRLLDIIKGNGGGVSVNNSSLVGGKTENVEVSLPSPTPSTDTSTVAGGWNQEFTKNPFSRQIVSSASVMSIATPSRLVQPPQTQQPILLSHQKQTPPVIRSSVLNMNNYSHSNIALQPNLSASPSRRPEAQYHMNPSSRMYTQQQQQMHHQNNSWMMSANHNNHNAYGNHHHRERSGSMGESAAFESWSPDNSPVRQTGQPGWNYGEPRTNFGHSYRPDRSRYRIPNLNPNPNPNPNPNLYPDIPRSNGNWRDDRRR